MATTGSNLFKGNQTISGSIIPAVNGLYDLGSITNEFRDLYLSSASLYIDGTKVLGSTTQELTITTDTGQSFKILEAGSDTITLQAADGNITLATSGGGDVILDPTSGLIALKGTTTLYAGNKILSSDGNAIQIGNSVTMTGSLIVTGFIETQELRTTYISSSILYRSGSTKFGDELGDTHSFTGSLTVSGSISIPGSGLVSGSSQITYGGLSGIPSGIISGSAQLPSGLVSGSAQVLNGSGVFSGSAQLPSGIVSSSAQTIANLPSGVVSGSAQTIANLPSGVVSGSAQTIANLPSGTVSGSSQVSFTGTTGYSTYINQAVLTTSSPTFAGLTNNSTYSQSTTSTQPVMIYGDSGDTNGLFRIQMDSISDSFGTGARTFLGDGGIDIFLGTSNSSYTPGNTYIALNHSGEISMGAGSATKHFILSTSGAATFSSTLQATNIGINNSPTGTKLFANQATDGEWIATFKNYGGSASYGVSIDMSGSISDQSAFQVYTKSGNGIRVLNSNGGLLVGTFTDISGKLVVKQPYTSATTPIYFGNSSFTAWNRNSYDTVILQQDDVASFRMVEKNGESNTSDQILCFSIGDGVGRIATSGQPLQFYVNGSPTGVTYQGLSGTQVLVMNTNGSAQFNYALGVSGAATLSSTATISGKLTVAGGYYLYGGGYNTSYTPDGLWGGSATPNKVQGVSGGNFILGYNDNGSGLYAPAYGFEVRQTDGLGANITMDAIIMRNTETGARPFIVTNKGSLTLAGSLSKGSGSFKINHPLQSKKNKNYLVHSFLEGPKADLLYRGKINLVNGLAIINIDTTAGMTEGTFEVLCRDVQCFTTNESGWDLVKGTINGNILTVTSQNSNSNDLISWLVIGERQDEHMYETEWTDENGHVILEPEIPEGVIL
jgi:hypothetical protein